MFFFISWGFYPLGRFSVGAFVRGAFFGGASVPGAFVCGAFLLHSLLCRDLSPVVERWIIISGMFMQLKDKKCIMKKNDDTCNIDAKHCFEMHC